MKNLKLFLAFLLVITALLVGYFVSSKTPGASKEPVEIYKNENGEIVLATGNCNQDADCKPSGCSNQICTNHEIVTTCEEYEFPEQETYSCGCVQSRCVWFR